MSQTANSYDLPNVYAKYIGWKKKDCGCGGSCHSCKTEDCGCCPPGTIRVNDENGNIAGCLTPNDAELYNDANVRCPEGYVKLYTNTGEFLGCVTVADALAYQQANP